MPRRENSVKVGPRSGRFVAGITIAAQTVSQAYRFYNTGDPLITVSNSAVETKIEKSCSADVFIPANTATTITVPTDGEGVYELLPSAGLRSGRFQRPGATNNTIVRLGPEGAIYRFFNTGKTLLRVTSGGMNPIAKECTADIFLAANSVTTVSNDKGVFDLVASKDAGPGYEVDGTVRSGHFKGGGTASIVVINLINAPTNAFPVIRVFNSGAAPFTVNIGTVAANVVLGTVPLECSIDLQIPTAMVRTVLIVGSNPEGSYDLLKVN